MRGGHARNVADAVLTQSRCCAARCRVPPPHSWTPRSACSLTSTSTKMWACATNVTPKTASAVTPMPTGRSNAPNRAGHARNVADAVSNRTRRRGSRRCELTATPK